MIKPSETIKDMMKGWEGLKLTAYKCPAGVLTIGYGHTGADVRPGMTITKAKADALFEADVDRFSLLVERMLVGVPVIQCQYDALVSIAYNIGIGNFRSSTLYAKVRKNPNDPTIRNEFMKWNKARQGGILKPLAGLTKRREAEADHYFKFARL